jgi:hypothetical protein
MVDIRNRYMSCAWSPADPSLARRACRSRRAGRVPGGERLPAG